MYTLQTAGFDLRHERALELAKATLDAVRVSATVAAVPLDKRAQWLGYCVRTTDVGIEVFTLFCNDPICGNVGRLKKVCADALDLANLEPGLGAQLSSSRPRDREAIRNLRREALDIMQLHFAPTHPDMVELRRHLGL